MENYYYSIPLDEGGFHNNAEDMFNKYEAAWTSIIEKLDRTEDITEYVEDIIAFVVAMRVRVPATRDTIELSLSTLVKAFCQHMNEKRQLPPAPEGFEH
jgi:Protein of unknown function (DUF4238)